jgi:hypothetical protein
MNFGPLEFAAYLRRKDDLKVGEPATVMAARAAAPAPLPLDARLTVISAACRLTTVSHDARPAVREAGGESEL